MPPKTTQRLHSHPIPTPAGPVDITTNYDAGWFAITAPETIPFEYLPAVIFALQQVDAERKRRMRTMRKRDNDSQTD